jgi:hypothetical protein
MATMIPISNPRDAQIHPEDQKRPRKPSATPPRSMASSATYMRIKEDLERSRRARTRSRPLSWRRRYATVTDAPWESMYRKPKKM